MRTVQEVLLPSAAMVRPETAFKKIVESMDSLRSSSLAVVDAAGRYLGMVTEDDVLMKEIYGPSARVGGVDIWSSQGERIKAAGVTAEQIMTDVPTVTEHTPLWEAASLMHDNGAIRLPVVDDAGAYVGIVTWRDLLSVFLRGDDALLREIVRKVKKLAPLDARDLEISVSDGVVSLDGTVEYEETIPLLVYMVGGIEGVVDIDAKITASGSLEAEAVIPESGDPE